MVEKYVDAWPAVPGNGFIVLDSSRRLWSTSIAGEKSALVDAAVPGTAAILAVHGNQVLLADGSRFGWFGERWVALGMPRAATDADSGATMRVRAIASFCVEPGKDLHTGDEMDLPEKRALELIQRRRVEPAVTVA